MFMSLQSNTALAANNPPQATSISPSSGTCNPEQEVYFTTTFSDPDGSQDLNRCYFMINMPYGSINSKN